jgi:hypothetical protein
MRTSPLWAICLLSSLTAAAVATAAEDEKTPAASGASGKSITIELNKLETVERACRGYFVVRNRTSDLVTELRLDVFLFDKNGIIVRRVGLTFSDLAPERTKVALFDLTDSPCDQVGRVLLNGVVNCTGAGNAALPGCTDIVRTTTRTSVPFDY